jgi:hypothetical protein
MLRACTPQSVEGGANNTPCHQVPRQLHVTTAHVSKSSPHSPHGTKKKNSGRTCTTLLGGGGGQIPRPPSTVTPRYDTPVPHASPSINPDLTIRPYLLTTLSAYQAYIQTHTCESYIINQGIARRPPVDKQKEPPACGVPAHLRPLNAVQGGLFLFTCFQFIAAMPKSVPV